MSTKEEKLKMEVVAEIAAQDDQAYKNVVSSLMNQKLHHEKEAIKLQAKLDALTLANYKDMYGMIDYRCSTNSGMFNVPSSGIYEVRKG